MLLSRVFLVIFVGLVLGKEKDYYKILGLSKKASEKEIKSAYRKLALQWHPDRNPNNKEEAEEKFREIAQAYEVLSNTESRRQYDLGGGSKGFGGFGNGQRSDFTRSGNFRDANDIFKDFFGSSDPFANFDKLFEDMATGSMGGFNFGGGTFSFSTTTMTTGSDGTTTTKTVHRSTNSDGRTRHRASVEESRNGRTTRRLERDSHERRRNSNNQNNNRRRIHLDSL
mmetsp:Transcript_15887/g.20893  ORF Transcript_15887/g.20893 Transcript_15887/m.20893 type:complete len:226 (-) Transcript_15887:767-1444(-)